MKRLGWTAGVMLCTFLTGVSYADEAMLTATPAHLVLSVNHPGLNIALTGHPRQVRLENTSDVIARNVTYTLIHFPQGMSVTPSQCGHIQPKQSCVLTITPGLNASSDAEIRFKGENTQAVSLPIEVLTYGSVYQGGYVFSIEDGAASVKGKVLSREDQVSPTPGIIWSSNGQGGRLMDAVFHAIPQIYDNTPLNCDGKADGACNTARIVNYYSRPMQHVPVPLKYYAAGICKQYRTDEQGHAPCTTDTCLEDWYLPAICEMDQVSAFIPESVVCPLNIQNIVANLNQLIDINCQGPQCLVGSYWSSTAHYDRGYPEYSAWDEDFNVSGSSQYNDDKNNQYGVRCVRAF